MQLALWAGFPCCLSSLWKRGAKERSVHGTHKCVNCFGYQCGGIRLIIIKDSVKCRKLALWYRGRGQCLSLSSRCWTTVNTLSSSHLPSLVTGYWRRVPVCERWIGWLHRMQWFLWEPACKGEDASYHNGPRPYCGKVWVWVVSFICVSAHNSWKEMKCTFV